MNTKKFFKSRLSIVCLGVGGLFLLLIAQFARLQLIEQTMHQEEIEYSTQRRIEAEGVRGEIFDRYGRPLAVNKPVYTLKLDQQVRMTRDELNESILTIVNLLEANGDTYIDEIPLTTSGEIAFTTSESGLRTFINSIPYNGTAHRDEIMTYDAEELFAYLRSDKVFQVDESYTYEEARKIVAIRHQMYQIAYQKYKPITIAENISNETLAQVEENHKLYPNIYTEIESYRYYPYGEAFGNILGYTRKITSSQYEAMAELGYNQNDKIGQMGIEQSMEQELRGQDGLEIIEVDNVGRKVSTIEHTKEVQGNDIFLTIDADVQIETYNLIERKLADAIITRLQASSSKLKPLAPRDVFVSMVESHQLDFNTMQKAPEGTTQYEVYTRIQPGYEPETYESFKHYFIAILEGEETLITDNELLLMLHEQGSLPLDASVAERVRIGQGPSHRQILIEALQKGTLKPDQMAIDPYSASAVAVDIHTGEVLALVSYPSYDSNEMTHNFNRYYSSLQDGIDERNLLWNRGLMTVKAPGSTFKMVTALAGLAEGVITPETSISCSGPFTKAGMPHPNCWYYTNNGYGHGAVDLRRALEVSCNSYFYEVAYRLGIQNGGAYGGIEALAQAAEVLGLGDNTGIELQETSPNISTPYNLINTTITKALNVIRNVTEKGQVILDGLAIEVLEAGGYEKKPGLFEAVNLSLINDFKAVFMNGTTAISEELTQSIFADTSSDSMKNKTKRTMQAYLESLVSLETDALFAEVEDSEEAAVLKQKVIASLIDYLIGNTSLEWTHAINVRTAIGQGNNAFTPTQMARYMATLANGETCYDLKLVGGITDHKVDATYKLLPDKEVATLNLPDSHLQAVYDGMYRVTSGREGTARTAFYGSEVTIAGKTGTAQEASTEHGWFAGFAPYDDPQIAVVTTMYGAYGLGSHNYGIASGLIHDLLVPEDKASDATLASQFLE